MTSLLALFLGFGRVGLFGFGGGPSMIPLMQAECVGSGWVTDEQFLEGLAVGNALPGPITTKMALFVGWTEAGVPGAVSAMLGLLLPSTVLMATLAAVLLANRDHPVVANALKGAKPAVIGMLAWTVWELAPGGIGSWVTAAFAVGAFALLVAKVHPAIVMVLAAGLGILVFR